MHMTRRQIIIGGALLTTSSSAIASPLSDALEQEETLFDVIVIGAGPAGLGAARRLADAGKSVIVLEARSRIGGRLFTNEKSMSVPIELGAELIHGGEEENSLWSIVKKHKIATAASNLDITRNNPSSPWVSSMDKEFYRFPLGEPPMPSSFSPLNDLETAENYLQRLGIAPNNQPLALRTYVVDNEQFNKMLAIDIASDVEALWTATGEEEDEEGGGDFRVPGGYVQLLDTLANSLPIRLGTVVKAVDVKDTHVVVSADSAGRDIRLRAKHCLVAVPAPVLLSGSIKFDPPMSAKKMAALNDGRQLPIAKILMEFEKPILPQKADMVTDFSLNPPCFWDASTGVKGFQGQVIVGWATGDAARELLGRPEKERFDQMLQSIRTISNDPKVMYINAKMHDWIQDQYALGAYGGWKDEEEILKPTGRLFWAGAVHSQVNYAYDSGVHAADQILRL